MVPGAYEDRGSRALLPRPAVLVGTGQPGYREDWWRVCLWSLHFFLSFGGLAHLISMFVLLFLSVVWSRGLEDLVASCLFVVLLFSSFSGGGMNGITFEAHNLFFAMT